MLPWKPLLAVVPAGLLLGLVAGKATRPVMLMEDERPWPQSMVESGAEADRWPSFDLSTPEPALRGYSYRPDIDYERYVWPDQTDRSAELLEADYDYDAAYEPDLERGMDLPLTRRAVAELAGRQAERMPAAAGAAEPQADAPERAEAERSAFVLPPVPPPLARAGVAPEDPEPVETEAF